jgi:hypothetical protein
LIREYQLWKGIHHVPKGVHNTLKWDKSNPFSLDAVEDAKWEILMNKHVNSAIQTELVGNNDETPQKRACRREPNYVVAKGSQALPTISNDDGR